jgi:hypothetical protein
MQDYFMALYIDKVGIKSASIPLGNAWMREPIRLIAAVSANPLGIIDAFLDEYKLNENRIYDKNNNSINDLADLMLNASEAIAYLPRFPSTKMGGVLHKSVLDLGLKAHNLYFRVSSNAVDKNKGTRVGWLGLMAKCLTAIKNIYASEFLRNNPSTCNIRRKTEKNREENIWKLIYRRLQQEPDSFQHLAYLQLYPIKRAQDHFPIRAYSLFYLAMDAAVCFPTAYDRLIKETHKTSLSRIPCWIAKKFEWLVSLLLPGLILSLIWYFDTTLGILLKLIYTLLAILSFITFARIIQALRFMNWRESHHFFTWLVLKTWKYTWSQVQLLGQFLADNTFYLFTYLWKLFINIPRLIRYSIELIRDLIVELVKTSFKHPTKIISVISLLVLVGIAYKYGVPYGASILKALEFSGRIETLSGNNAEIDKQLPVFKQKTSEFLNETPSEISQNKQSQLLKEIGEYNERLINMQNDGNSLLVASQELPKSEQEINTYLSEINKKSQLLKELESEILRKGEEIHYVLRLEFYKKKLVETENETQELLKYYKDSSVDNSSSISTDITKCITRIEELLNEKEGLIQFNPEISGEISPRLQQLQWGKEQLELIVAELAQKGGIASSASNSESSTTNETLKTQLDNRADQVLARTVLEDISENRTFITKLLLQNGQKLSEIEKSLSADSESLSERIGFIRRGNIDSNLQFLSRLESIDNQFPQMKSQLSTYKTELSDVIADVRSGQYVMEKLSLLEKRLSEVNICLSELDKYTVLREQFNIKLIQDTLTQKKDEADKLSAQQVSSLGGILISAVIFLFILFIRNRYGDETGIQKLLLIKGNFGALLDFVKDNRYSDKVNEIAIAYLREALPSDSQSLRLSLRLISDAAEQRFKKAGELNESVGYLLFDLEKGIENIVNRESTSK